MFRLCSLIKGVRLKICLLCFVWKNNIVLNFLYIWILYNLIIQVTFLCGMMYVRWKHIVFTLFFSSFFNFYLVGSYLLLQSWAFIHIMKNNNVDTLENEFKRQGKYSWFFYGGVGVGWWGDLIYISKAA